MDHQHTVALHKLKAMDFNGSSIYLNWFEEGGAEVFRCWDVWVLFSVPQYGGEPTYEGTFFEYELEKLVSIAYSWT